jgi:hypothetical protein
MDHPTTGPILHFLGDSHVRSMAAAVHAGLFQPLECRVEEVGGATAVGLRHPTSKTQALAHFRDRLTPVDPRVIPIFQLGEVDCGFVIWVRAQRYGESIVAQLEGSLEAYRDFLIEQRGAGYRPVVTSATLPTIRDGQLDGEVALLRAEVRASHRARTDLTLDYNARLAEICGAEGLLFVDATPDLLDPATGLLSDSFRHPDPSDHHLDPKTAGPVWARRIRQALALV